MKISKELEEWLSIFNTERFNEHYRALIFLAVESGDPSWNNTLSFIADLEHLVMDLKKQIIQDKQQQLNKQ